MPKHNNIKSKKEESRTAPQDNSSEDLSFHPDDYSSDDTFDLQSDSSDALRSIDLLDSDSDYTDSVFKVMVKTKDYDYDNPWHPPMQNSHSGSGFAVSYEGQTFLLTNAHVASTTGRMFVRLSNDADEYKAEAVLIENDCDLAIIKVDSPEFNEKIKPLPLGEMVKLRQNLTVHGFPMGGEELCITEGKVSRIQVDTYVQAGTNLLQAQVSAEINPGNSGGPVISDGKIVGVAFQGYNGGDGLGYIIPVPIMQHLLQEALDIDNYKGFPDINFNYQELKNETLRTHFGLEKNETGIRVKSIPKLSAARDILKINDIILKIDGNPIKNDGTTETEFSKRMQLDYLISRNFIGEKLQFEILRDKQRMTVYVELQNRSQTTKRVQQRFEEAPTYFIVSGIALCPLTDNLLNNIMSDDLIKYANKEKRKPGQEIVVIKSILACDHNYGFDYYEEEAVKKINGKHINNIRDAVKSVEDNTSDTHVIETKNGHILAVPNLTEKQHKKLLKEFDIHRDRSRDLKRDPVYKPGCPEYKAFLPGFSAKMMAASTSLSQQETSTEQAHVKSETRKKFAA